MLYSFGALRDAFARHPGLIPIVQVVHPAHGRPVLMLDLNNVSKSFLDGESKMHILQGIDLWQQAGHNLALLGAICPGCSSFAMK